MNLLLANNTAGGSWWVYVLMIVAVVFLLIFPIFTNKKRNKEYTEMLNQLSVGDEIKTVGGIIGRIQKINKENGMPKSIIIETGAKGSAQTLELDISYIAFVLNQVNPPKKAEDDVKASNKAETKTDAKAEAQNTEEGISEVSAENEQTVEDKAEEKAPETAAVKPNKQNKSKNKKK